MRRLDGARQGAEASALPASERISRRWATCSCYGALARLGAPADRQDALGRSLPDWPSFPEVAGALEEAQARGWRLAVLSNTDRDLLAASLARSGADRARHVHVAASLFHDIGPASGLGLRTVWIDRLGEEAEPQPDIELRSLTGLAESLDSLVAA